MASPTFIPPAAQRLMDSLRKRGHSPTCTPAGKQFLVAVDTDRVHATARFRKRSSGWQHLGGVLTIDGQRCPTAGNLDELDRIISDPDRYLVGAVAKEERDFVEAARTCPVPPTSDPVDGSTAPPAVRTVAAALRELPDCATRMVYEQPNKGTWQIRYNAADDEGYTLVVVFRRARRDWHIRRFALVNAVGDMARDLGGSIEEAMRALQSNETPAGELGVDEARQAPRGKNDQVAVKTRTVLRL